MAALFLLQIVSVSTGQVVRLPGGGLLERDLIQGCTDAILSKEVGPMVRKGLERATAQGLGVFRTEAQVTAAVEAAMTAAIRDGLGESIREGITEAIRELKHETRRVVT